MHGPFPDDPRPWQVLERRYLHQRPWLTLREDRVRLSSGVEIAQYWVTEFPPWVNVIPVTRQGELVLIRQYRHGLGAVHFELPAGVADPGDRTVEEAARRELREETGYTGGRWSPFMTLSANPALQTNTTHTFLAEGVELTGPDAREGTEDLRVHLIAPTEVEPLVDRGGFMQALHVAPLLRYLLLRGRSPRPA